MGSVLSPACLAGEALPLLRAGNVFVLTEAMGTGDWAVPVGRESSLACVAVDWESAAANAQLRAMPTAVIAPG